MAKKTVKFTYADGRKLTKTNGAYSVKSPLSYNLTSNQSKYIDVGFTCDKPVMVFVTRGMIERNVFSVPVHKPEVFDAGEKIVLFLTNTGKNEALIDEGEVIARLIVMDNSDQTEE